MLPTKIVKFSHAKDVEYNVFEKKLIRLKKKQKKNLVTIMIQGVPEYRIRF